MRALSYVGDNSVNAKGLLDPAFFAAQYFREKHAPDYSKHYFAVNFRHLYIEDNFNTVFFTFSDCINILEKLSRIDEESQTILVPMHTFFKGGDDRIILNRLAQQINDPRVVVQNIPLSLEQTMRLYQNATICVGMRFHSIVLQTILNGKNYVLDYTDSQNGKIVNMLGELHLLDKIEGRYVHPTKMKDLVFKTDVDRINVSEDILNSYKNQYVELIKSQI